MVMKDLAEGQSGQVRVEGFCWGERGWVVFVRADDGIIGGGSVLADMHSEHASKDEDERLADRDQHRKASPSFVWLAGGDFPTR